MSTLSREWKRLLVEGVVIVVSILFAFAIDAWWEERQQLGDAEDQVARIVAELRVNVELLQAQDEALTIAVTAAHEFLALFGPEPEPTTATVIGNLMGRLYSVPTLALERSASADFLSSGQLTQGRWADFRSSLAGTLSGTRTAERSSVELRAMRPGIGDRLHSYVPGLELVRDHALMRDYQPSRFTSDTVGLLSDMQFEGLIATYAIRLEINRRNTRDLLERYEALITDVETMQALGNSS